MFLIFFLLTAGKLAGTKRKMPATTSKSTSKGEKVERGDGSGGCPYEFSKGKNAGEFCGKKARGGGEFCSAHSKKEDREEDEDKPKRKKKKIVEDDDSD